MPVSLVDVGPEVRKCKMGTRRQHIALANTQASYLKFALYLHVWLGKMVIRSPRKKMRYLKSMYVKRPVHSSWLGCKHYKCNFLIYKLGAVQLFWTTID